MKQRLDTHRPSHGRRWSDWLAVRKSATFRLSLGCALLQDCVRAPLVSHPTLQVPKICAFSRSTTGILVRPFSTIRLTTTRKGSSGYASTTPGFTSSLIGQCKIASPSWSICWRISARARAPTIRPSPSTTVLTADSGANQFALILVIQPRYLRQTELRLWCASLHAQDGFPAGRPRIRG